MTTPIGPGSTAAVLTASATTPPDSHLGVAEGNDEMMAVLPAVPSSLRQTRHLVAQWLADAGWPTIAAEDFVLAVNEATANVVDHAYPDDAPGNVHLHGWIAPSPTAGRVVVQRPAPDSPQNAMVCTATVAVVDHGRWSADRRTVAPGGHRGHGLAVMIGVMAQVHLQRSAGGTTVLLVGHVAPAQIRQLPPTLPS